MQNKAKENGFEYLPPIVTNFANCEKRWEKAEGKQRSEKSENF